MTVPKEIKAVYYASWEVTLPNGNISITTNYIDVNIKGRATAAICKQIHDKLRRGIIDDYDAPKGNVKPTGFGRCD